MSTQDKDLDKDLDKHLIWPDQSEMVLHMPRLERIASRCRVIVELGCGHGNGSTRAFERGLERTEGLGGPHQLFVSVDEDPERPQCKPLARYWYKISGDSRHTWPVEFVIIVKEGAPVDLIYVDTVHVYDQLAAELETWKPVATEETLWLFHDTWMFGDYNQMTDAILDFCRVNPQWEYVELTRESHGLGAMRWVGGKWADKELA